MQDRISAADHVAVKLECGHPNTLPNEQCALCGYVVELPGKGAIQVAHEAVDEALAHLEQVKGDEPS